MEHGKRVFLLMAECSVFSSEFGLRLHCTCLTIIIHARDARVFLKITILGFSPEENKVSNVSWLLCCCYFCLIPPNRYSNADGISEQWTA